jgi:hypothetical protein
MASSRFKSINKMGLRYRIKKRRAADHVMGQLLKTLTVINKVQDEETHYPGYAYLPVSHFFNDKYSKDMIRGACQYLWKSGHTDSLQSEDWNATKLKANITGMYAYQDGYYADENMKDISTFIETAMRWILPILSLVISIIALYVSALK